MFYNQTRPHHALDGQPPDQVYYKNLTTRQTAASSAIRQVPLMNWQKLSQKAKPPLFQREGMDAYSTESGHRFRANPATPRSPATQGFSVPSLVANFRLISPTVCVSILLSV